MAGPGDASSLFGAAGGTNSFGGVFDAFAGISENDLAFDAEGEEQEQQQNSATHQLPPVQPPQYNRAYTQPNAYQTPTMPYNPYFGGPNHTSPQTYSPGNATAPTPTERKPTSALQKKQVDAYDPPMPVRPPSSARRAASSTAASAGIYSPASVPTVPPPTNYMNNGLPGMIHPPNANTPPPPNVLRHSQSYAPSNTSTSPAYNQYNSPRVTSPRGSFDRSNAAAPPERPSSAISRKTVNAYDPPMPVQPNVRRGSAVNHAPHAVPGRMSPFNPAAQERPPPRSRPTSPFTQSSQYPPNRAVSPPNSGNSVGHLPPSRGQSPANAAHMPSMQGVLYPPAAPALPSYNPVIPPVSNGERFPINYNQPTPPPQPPRITQPRQQPSGRIDYTNKTQDPELAQLESSFDLEILDEDAVPAGAASVKRHNTTSSHSSAGTAGGDGDQSPQSRRGSFSHSPMPYTIDEAEEAPSTPAASQTSFPQSSFPQQAPFGVQSSYSRRSPVASPQMTGSPRQPAAYFGEPPASYPPYQSIMSTSQAEHANPYQATPSAAPRPSPPITIQRPVQETPEFQAPPKNSPAVANILAQSTSSDATVHITNTEEEESSTRAQQEVEVEDKLEIEGATEEGWPELDELEDEIAAWPELEEETATWAELDDLQLDLTNPLSTDVTSVSAEVADNQQRNVASADTAATIVHDESTIEDRHDPADTQAESERFSIDEGPLFDTPKISQGRWGEEDDDSAHVEKADEATFKSEELPVENAIESENDGQELLQGVPIAPVPDHPQPVTNGTKGTFPSLAQPETVKAQSSLRDNARRSSPSPFQNGEHQQQYTPKSYGLPFAPPPHPASHRTSPIPTEPPPPFIHPARPQSRTSTPPVSVTKTDDYHTAHNIYDQKPTSNDHYTPTNIYEPMRANVPSPRMAPKVLPPIGITKTPIGLPPGLPPTLPSAPQSKSVYAPKILQQVAQTGRKPYPVACFSFGGRLLTCFPSAFLQGSTSYGGYSNGPANGPSQGTVTVHKLGPIISDTSLDAFPGPLLTGNKGNNSKLRKDVISWLEKRATELETEAIYTAGTSDNKPGSIQAAGDRRLLVLVLKLLVENDGKLSGVTKAEEQLREILTPPHLAESTTDSGTFQSAMDIHLMRQNTSSPPIAQSTMTSSDLNKLKQSLAKGDRRGAVRYACDRKLWAHALLLAGSVDREAWKEVVSEFVQSDLSAQGKTSTEPLQLLYGMLGGLGAAAVDELLPKQQLNGRTMKPAASMQPPSSGSAPQSRSTTPAPMATIDLTKFNNVPAHTLDSWQESALYIVSNKCPGDSAALSGLAEMLTANQRLDAAQVCAILALPPGSPASMAPRLTLLGGSTDTEAIMLTEIIEFALSLQPVVKGQEPFIGLPALQAYRLVHALHIAEAGSFAQALKYCEAIEATMKLASKRPALYNSTLLAHLQVLTDRLSNRSGNSANSGSWMSRKTKGATLDSFWGSLEGRFTSFVAGETPSEKVSTPPPVAPPSDLAVGPFSHYSAISPAQTPSAPSRVQSSTDLKVGATSAPALQSSFYTPAASYHPTNGLPPMPPPFQPPKAPEAKGHAHKRSQSMGFLAFGGDPYASAPSWAPPSAGLSETDPIPEETETSSPEIARSDEKFANNADANSWWHYGNAAGGEATRQPLFQQVDAPVHQDESGFISMMDQRQPAHTHAAAASIPADAVQYDEEDDLGFGNSKARPKSSEAETTTEIPAKEHRRGNSRSESAARSMSPSLDAPSPAIRSSTSYFSLGRLFRKDSASPAPTGPVKANLGEETSFVYDPDLKRWVNKKAGASNDAAAAAPAAPPARSKTTTPSASPTNPAFSAASPPLGPPPRPPSAPPRPASAQPSLSSGPPMPTSADGPPQRRAVSGAAKKSARSRYVEIT